MSDQTARARPPRSFAWGFAVSLLVTAGLIYWAIGPAGAGYVGRMAGRGHLHAPRFELIAEASFAIKLHLATILGAFVVATVIMFGPKGTLLHRTLGWGFATLMTTTAVVALFISGFHFTPLQLFSVFVLSVLPIGVMAARGHNVARHARTMTGLYIGSFVVAGLVAFLPGRLMWQVFFG